MITPLGLSPPAARGIEANPIRPRFRLHHYGTCSRRSAATNDALNAFREMLTRALPPRPSPRAAAAHTGRIGRPLSRPRGSSTKPKSRHLDSARFRCSRNRRRCAGCEHVDDIGKSTGSRRLPRGARRAGIPRARLRHAPPDLGDRRSIVCCRSTICGKGGFLPRNFFHEGNFSAAASSASSRRSRFACEIGDLVGVAISRTNSRNGGARGSARRPIGPALYQEAPTKLPKGPPIANRIALVLTNLGKILNSVRRGGKGHLLI